MNPKDVVVRYVQAVADGDLDTIIASFADDTTWTYPGDVPLTGTWTGREGSWAMGVNSGIAPL